jgi:hypothetical protein
MNARNTSRRTSVKESFSNAAECIGKIEKGMSLFAITRGQFSMIDTILVCLDQLGLSFVSVWTWTIAEYEIQCFERLRRDNRVQSGSRLIIDYCAREKNLKLIQLWRNTFGIDTIRYVKNHAKIARIRNSEYKLLIRGSFNLNFNPRFEQFDITEGGKDFELIDEIENDLPLLADNCAGGEVYNATKLQKSFDTSTLKFFNKVQTWKK